MDTIATEMNTVIRLLDEEEVDKGRPASGYTEPPSELPPLHPSYSVTVGFPRHNVGTLPHPTQASRVARYDER